MAFIINWQWRAGEKCYVTPRQPDHKPYTSEPADAKRWKTRKNAERFLSLKDKGWATNCKIEEVA